MKKFFIGLIVLGLALSMAGCGGVATTGGVHVDGCSITGFFGAYQSGTDVPYMFGGDADTIDDAVITAYSDSSYTTSVDSHITYCSSLEDPGPVAYVLIVPEGSTYYLKAIQVAVNNEITRYHYAILEVTVGSEDILVEEYVTVYDQWTVGLQQL